MSSLGRLSLSSTLSSTLSSNAAEFPALDVESVTTPSRGSASTPQLLLNDDPFSNEESKHLFDAIDDLRNCGAGQDLDIPQLVIVGNQSAGKSSLLRSLTGIPFKVGGGLCTRFATRIVSRRTPPDTSDQVVVSIEPGDINPFSGEVNDEKLQSFKHSMSSITEDAFQSIVEQASKYMGILERNGSRTKNFSSKVLKIDLSGPDRSHFSILDLPGVFSVPTSSITADEMGGVDQIVSSYVKKPQNIIVCVAPANNDLVHQKILNLANVNDMSRMVGVFTKCDAASQKEARFVVNIIKEKRDIHLEKVWFVVHNPDFDEPSPSAQQQADQFTFNQYPWNELPKDRCGISVLKAFLGKLLCRQIRSVFPMIQNTIKEILVAEEGQLQLLGEPRKDRQQRLQYIMHVVREYNSLAHRALSSPESLPLTTMKLRGLERKEAEKFKEVIETIGGWYRFSEVGEPADAAGDAPIYEDIKAQIIENRGEELPGLFNPAIVRPIFKKQICNWEPLGIAHLNDIITKTYDVSMLTIEYVSENNNVPVKTRQRLKDIIIQFRDEAGKRAIDKIKKFCHDSYTNPLYTNNDAFKMSVQQSRHRRFTAALRKYQQMYPAGIWLRDLKEERDLTYFKDFIILSDNKDGIDSLFRQIHPSEEQNMINEIHDLLSAYYKVAVEDYKTYVTNHIREPFLSDPKGPLLGLSQEFILGLSEEEQERLGEEDDATVRARTTTEERVHRLRQAKRIADDAMWKTRRVADD